MKIIKVKMTSDRCYHIDCSIFPITKESTMVATKLFSREEIKEIEKYTEIIHVPSKYAEAGATNNVRCHNLILNASDILDLDPSFDGEDYFLERDKNLFLEDLCSELGMEMCFVNISEYLKAGALLSCNIMHLNRFSYGIDLI